MTNVDFIGKCLLIKEDDERVLVIADLHLGYEGSLREEGILVPSDLYKEYIDYLDIVFGKIKEEKGKNKIEKIVIVGDLKHEIGKIIREEWKEVSDFLDYLKKNCSEIVIVKGNHDVVIEPIVNKKDIKTVNYFVWKEFCFLHGDKDFEILYNKKIKYWIMGHLHPAVNLRKGVKRENYKCFLNGIFGRKRVIILPSFFEMNEGSDPRYSEPEMAWSFQFGNFNVKVVGEKMEVLDFGKLRDIGIL